ncbi:uncharacterized protein [Medicago truncatula]|uniref:uncharacterized protein n=1 Tax=Medicago truncatula TaxID=3880 RepID=UPI000D2F240C|nr:uncharacterized protein LOC112422724 [Medicago truncatula]
MTITLDDVHNLLHIPIHGCMLDHDEAMGQERVIDLMTMLLGMLDVDARAEIRTESAVHISYTTLKRVDKLLASVHTIEKWSWGGMTLVYLYDYLDDSVILNNRTMAGSTTLFMGWILEHLSGPYPRKTNKSWKPERPYAWRWLTSRGHTDVHHYRLLLDRLEVDDVRFSTYGDHREIHPFQLIVTYSEWLMCGKERVYRHLPEWVKRHLFYVHDVPRHPSSVAQMPTHSLTTVLQNAQAWFFTAWGDACERPCHHAPGYMAWYAKVSHPRILPPDEGSPPRPANMEQIIEDEHARDMPDTLMIIRDVVHIVDDIVDRQAEMTKEEIVQEVMRIADTSRPALTYQIARRRREPRHARQQG